MPKFITYDPTLTAPAFSGSAEVEIKTRSGRVIHVDEPWMMEGWNHTGGPNDIMEFRLVKGSMTPQKKPAPKVEMSEIERDARIFCGLPPYRGWSNTSQGDPYFDSSCRGKYGDAAWAAQVKSVVEREDAIRAAAEQIATVDEIARKRDLPVNRPSRDKDVELKALLKEVIDVLHCHHRNTHKPLLERVRKYRSSL